MDPSTTLFTFLLETDPSIQSVHLIGSWDNFLEHNIMERDVRRGGGQWRGCYTFRDVVCDDDETAKTQKRNGGLKMGHTYYYYYEINGSTETHDPTLPLTNLCPYLPGQTVNTMTVPIQQSSRHRSASLSSICQSNFCTMNPNAKFISPRPAPSVPQNFGPRIGSAPHCAPAHRTSSGRSLSSAAWKSFFSRKSTSRDRERGRSSDRSERLVISRLPEESRSCMGASPRPRSRDISPESLHRFLVDDLRSGPPSASSEHMKNPDDIVEDMDEDEKEDDNFISLAISESQPYPTKLSPPPYSRATSTSSDLATNNNASSLTVTAVRPTAVAHSVNNYHSQPISTLAKLETKTGSSYSSVSPGSSSLTSPTSPRSLDEDPNLSCDSDRDEDYSSVALRGRRSHHPLSAIGLGPQACSTYRLPQEDQASKGSQKLQPTLTHLNSTQLLESQDGNFLGTPIDNGLDAFVDELGWMVDTMGIKTHASNS